ncbi:MAG TPA: nickel pincer cofactor biosynthesis protein LarC, partial [Bacteroidetes bacterium]|nr:nickel pincer cofactor biosynthesis protein LarC [Bacteroidota bacterium]
AISATKVDVLVDEQKVQRNLHDLEAIVAEADLPQRVKQRAVAVFRKLAEAEAAVHGTSVDQIHFHEVGALDSIADVIGTAIGLEELGVEKLWASPVAVGQGFVQAAHGRLPVPAPATVRLLRNFEIRLARVNAELTTPTGAAILAALAEPTPDVPPFKLQSVGFGAGGRDLPDRPNVLRLLVGELPAPLEHEEIAVLECQVDDMNPEILPYVVDRLLQEGALDVVLQPVIMKKGRPGNLVQVLSPLEKVQTLTELLLRETSSIGVRWHRVQRAKLPRRQVEVQTSLGRVKAKELKLGDQVWRTPEFEECKRLAAEHGLPLRRVYERLTRELNPEE